MYRFCVDLAERIRVYLKAELKKVEVDYVELANRLKKDGFKEDAEASITNELNARRLQLRFCWLLYAPRG